MLTWSSLSEKYLSVSPKEKLLNLFYSIMQLQMHLGIDKTFFFIFIWLQSLHKICSYKFWTPVGNPNFRPSLISIVLTLFQNKWAIWNFSFLIIIQLPDNIMLADYNNSTCCLAEKTSDVNWWWHGQWSGDCIASGMLEVVKLRANKVLDLKVRWKSHLLWLQHFSFCAEMEGCWSRNITKSNLSKKTLVGLHLYCWGCPTQYIVLTVAPECNNHLDFILYFRSQF